MLCGVVVNPGVCMRARLTSLLKFELLHNNALQAVGKILFSEGKYPHGGGAFSLEHIYTPCGGRRGRGQNCGTGETYMCRMSFISAF